ncbi:hypothetical protein D5S17_30710 [Pseudonocardiaceae bacterium YIM PH 21723]|nr:hypothetical protein D5S17_30710 [Pseudonocardiaceae bacterium YIM PH 21723]
MIETVAMPLSLGPMLDRLWLRAPESRESILDMLDRATDQLVDVVRLDPFAELIWRWLPQCREGVRDAVLNAFEGAVPGEPVRQPSAYEIYVEALMLPLHRALETGRGLPEFCAVLLSIRSASDPAMDEARRVVELHILGPIADHPGDRAALGAICPKLLS